MPQPHGVLAHKLGVQTSNMNISQIVKNYIAYHISTETYWQVETIKSIIDPEYINLVGQNSHAILG